MSQVRVVGSVATKREFKRRLPPGRGASPRDGTVLGARLKMDKRISLAGVARAVEASRPHLGD